jgi:hypothetical protein
MKHSDRRNITGIVLLCLILLIFPAASKSINTSNRTLPNGQWEKLISDPAFNYKNEKELVKLPPPSSSIFSKLLKGLILFFASTIGKVICWSILLCIVSYAIYKIFISNATILFNRSYRTQRDRELPGTPETLFDTNWELKLDEALNSRSNRSAVRYSYMLILHLLEQRQLISYTANKTNYEYNDELKSSPYGNLFRTVSRQYEYVWYGNYALSQKNFDEYMSLFADMKKLLER